MNSKFLIVDIQINNVRVRVYKAQVGRRNVLREKKEGLCRDSLAQLRLLFRKQNGRKKNQGTPLLTLFSVLDLLAY